MNYLSKLRHKVVSVRGLVVQLQFTKEEAMTKADIVDTVAGATGLTRSEVSAVFDGVLKVIASELADGGSIELRRFGTFKPVKRAARQALNPRTGEPVRVAARVVPVFKPSPQLKALVGHN